MMWCYIIKTSNIILYCLTLCSLSEIWVLLSCRASIDWNFATKFTMYAAFYVPCTMYVWLKQCFVKENKIWFNIIYRSLQGSGVFLPYCLSISNRSLKTQNKHLPSDDQQTTSRTNDILINEVSSFLWSGSCTTHIESTREMYHIDIYLSGSLLVCQYVHSSN